MHFKSEAKIKATLEIGSKKYEFKSPTVGQKEAMTEAVIGAASTAEKNLAIKNFMALLSGMKVEELSEIDSETFDALFDHILSVKKN